MEINKNLPTHYRYNTHESEDGVTIRVSKFYPVRETECFYYVVGQNQLLKGETRTYSKEPKLRRVGKNCLRGYCFPSKKLALKSFKARQNSRIWHAKYSLSVANQSLLVLDKIEPGAYDHLDVGMPEFLKCLDWG